MAKLYESLSLIYNKNMITSIQEESNRPQKRTQNEYESMYAKLHSFIDNINEKVISRIQLVQHVYAQDYQTHIAIMKEQLARIKSELDANLLRQKANQTMFYLEEERDFFRGQAMKLNGKLQKMAEDNKKLRETIDTQLREIQSFKQVAMNRELQMQKIKSDALDMRNYQRVMSSPKLTVLTASRADAVKREQEERTAAKTMTPFTENGSMRVKVSKQANTCSNFAKQDMILTRMSLRRSDEASERERIIDACIKELKKQIFYRSIDPKETNKIHFQEFRKVSFDNFTKTDRRELVKRILQDELILNQFSDYLLSRKDTQTISSLTRKISLHDQQANTRQLQQIKKEYCQRILDIKSAKH